MRKMLIKLSKILEKFQNKTKKVIIIQIKIFIFQIKRHYFIILKITVKIKKMIHLNIFQSLSMYKMELMINNMKISLHFIIKDNNVLLIIYKDI